METDTGELLKVLNSISHTDSIADFTRHYFDDKTVLKLHEYLAQLIKQYSLDKSDIIIKSNLPRTYAYQIFNGTRNPGKDKLLALCLSMDLSLSETQRALSIADLGNLYANRKRDAIIIFSINKKLGLNQANVLLTDLEELPIE